MALIPNTGRKKLLVVVILLAVLCCLVIGLYARFFHGDAEPGEVTPRLPFTEPPPNLSETAQYWLTPPSRRLPLPAPSVSILKVPGDHQTIQNAIDASPEGGHVLVGPGRYEETLRFGCKSVFVHSERGPAETVVDAVGRGSAAHFAALEGDNKNCRSKWQTVLSGFTLTGGTGTEDIHEGNLHIQGGGIYIRSLSPILVWNIIEENKGGNGGGVLCDLGCEALIANNWIRRNHAEKGGGIRISHSSPIVVNNVIQANQASKLGAGLYWRGPSAPVITHNTVIGNRAGGMGGGFFGSNMPLGQYFVTLANNIVAENESRAGAGIGVNLAPTAIRLTNNLFSEGNETVFRVDEGTTVIWESNNVIAKIDEGEALRPGPGFAGEANGSVAWANFLTYDFIGQPRIRQDPNETVDIGAIQVTNDGNWAAQWGSWDYPESR